MNLGKLKLSVNKNVDAPKPVEPATESPAPVAAPKPPAGIKLGGLRLPVRSADSTPASSSVGSRDLVVPERVPDAEVVANNTVDESKPISTPEGFQALLDRFDAMIVAGQGVTQLTLDTCRKYVASIYTELKINPNLDEIFKDRDMHNVMAFVQRSTLQAKEVIQVKKAKSETRAAKKALVNADFGDMDFGFGADDSPNQTAAAVAVGKAMKTQDLSGFADINTDEIAAQVHAARKK